VKIDTAISNYNRLEGIKNIVTDMKLRLQWELRDVPEMDLADYLYIKSLADLVEAATVLQLRLSWDPGTNSRGEDV
jgi:hypothetical protein